MQSFLESSQFRASIVDICINLLCCKGLKSNRAIQFQAHGQRGIFDKPRADRNSWNSNFFNKGVDSLDTRYPASLRHLIQTIKQKEQTIVTKPRAADSSWDKVF